MRKCVFTQSIINIWNSLPVHVVNSRSVNSFKNKTAELSQRRPRDALNIWVPWKVLRVLTTHLATFPEICNSLFYRSILRMCVQNLKFVALPVPEIIGCPYHVTFDLDLDLEHNVDAGAPGDHRVQVWSQSSHLPARISDFRSSTKVPVSRDLWPWPWPWAHPGCRLTCSPSCVSLVSIEPFACEKKRF